MSTGIQHQISINFCACESEAVTLLRYGFWPATPKRLSLAFSICLLESAKALLLDGQVSAMDMVRSLETRCQWLGPDYKSVG